MSDDKWRIVEKGRALNYTLPIFISRIWSREVILGYSKDASFYDNNGYLVTDVEAWMPMSFPEPYIPPLRKECDGCPHYSRSIKWGSLSIICWKHRLCEHLITGETRREVKPFMTSDNKPCDKED